MIKHLAIISTSLFFFTSCLQAQQDKINYKVDSSIKEKVNKQTSSTNGAALGHMEVKMFENDSLIFDSNGKDKKLEFFTMTNMKKDTIHIIGFSGIFSGFGFYLALCKDSCSIKHFVKSDAEIYKMNKSDTTLTFGLSIPCLQKSLTLVKKPTFKEGEIIEGILELTSQDYWEVANGHERKYRMQLIAYFTTEGVKNDN